MTDDTGSVWRRTEIESPCENVCILSPETRLCIGCRRTGDEIAAWSRLTPEDRRRIMADLPGRDAGPRRKGGRAARIKRG